MLLRTLVLVLSLPASALAETTLSPILVSAARTDEQGLDIPAATKIIGQDEIERSGAHNVADLLRRVSGVRVADGVGGGGNARIDMRGFGGTAQSNTAILINGRKINPATDSATLYLNSINLTNVDQIEIIRGSSGVLYGNQAVGGLINIISKRPDTRTRHARIGAGSFDGWALQGGFTEFLGDRTRISVQAEKSASDNYRDRNASRLERLDARLDVEHHAGYSYVDAQYLSDYVQTPGALFANELSNDREQAVFDDDYLDTHSRVLRLGTHQDLDPRWRLEGELALRDDDRNFVQSFRSPPGLSPFPSSRSTQDRDSIEVTPRLIGRFSDRILTLGVDYLTTDYALLTAFGPQGNDQDIVALYGQLKQPLGTTLDMTLGIRHAKVNNDIDNDGMDVSIDDSETVGSIGFSYRPDPAWRLFLRADQNYRFAKVDEHTNVPFGQPVGLDTQHGISYETGAEYSADGFDLAIDAYSLRLRDEISFDAATFSNINLPRSRRYGMSMSANLDLGLAWRVGAGYEYIDSEISSGTHAGSQVPLVPEHSAEVYVEYLPTNDWFVRLDLAYTDEQFLGSDYANTASKLDSYTVADLTVQHDLGDWRLRARVNNLFDEEYSETGASSFAGDGFNPAAERNFWIEASYRLKN